MLSSFAPHMDPALSKPRRGTCHNNHFLQGLFDQSMGDGQVCKWDPCKPLLEGHTALQLLLGVLSVVDQSPESGPDVPCSDALSSSEGISADTLPES